MLAWKQSLFSTKKPRREVWVSRSPANNALSSSRQAAPPGPVSSERESHLLSQQHISAAHYAPIPAPEHQHASTSKILSKSLSVVANEPGRGEEDTTVSYSPPHMLCPAASHDSPMTSSVARLQEEEVESAANVNQDILAVVNSLDRQVDEEMKGDNRAKLEATGYQAVGLSFSLKSSTPFSPSRKLAFLGPASGDSKPRTSEPSSALVSDTLLSSASGSSIHPSLSLYQSSATASGLSSSRVPPVVTIGRCIALEFA